MYLTRDFFRQTSPVVAEGLLGCVLERTLPGGDVLTGLIVETEAYLMADDGAAHAARGRTHGVRALYEDGGTLYMHPMRQWWGLDTVAGPVGEPWAVLIRAMQPLTGVDVMRQLVGVDDVHRIANGPGKLSRALALDGSFYGQNVCDETCALRIRVRAGNTPDVAVVRGPRIGITKSVELDLRFTVQGSRYLSRPASRR